MHLAGQIPRFPTTVGRGGCHLVPAFNQQLPQLRWAHRAGKATGHSNDRHGVVMVGRLGWHGRGRSTAEDLRAQERRDRPHGRIVEDESGGQTQASRGTEAFPHVERDQRVDTHIAERFVHRNVVGRGVAEGHRRLLSGQGQQHAELFTLTSTGQLRTQACPRCLVNLVISHVLGNVLDQRAWPSDGVRRGEAFPVNVRDGQQALVVVQRLLHCLDRQRGVHRPKSHPGQSGHAQPTGRLRRAPQAPTDRRCRQAACSAFPRQAIQVGVGCRVDPLATAPPGRGTRGEQHERVQIQVARQLVQIPCTDALPGEVLNELRAGTVDDLAVVAHSGRVENRSQRELVRDRPDHLGQGIPISHITHGHRHLDTGSTRLLDQIGCPASAAHQHHVLDARPHQPPHDVRSHATGPTGHQRSSPGPPLRFCRGRHRRPHQSPGEHPALGHRQLILADPGEHTDRIREPPATHIDHSAPQARQLQTHHLAQPPHRTSLAVNLAAQPGSPTCHHPQWAPQPSVHHSLDHHDRRPQPHRAHRPGHRWPILQHRADPRRDSSTVVTRGDADRHRVHAAAGQRGRDHTAEFIAGVGEDQPGPRRTPGRRRGHGPPLHAVPPPVDDRIRRHAPADVRQRIKPVVPVLEGVSGQVHRSGTG